LYHDFDTDSLQNLALIDLKHFVKNEFLALTIYCCCFDHCINLCLFSGCWSPFVLMEQIWRILWFIFIYWFEKNVSYIYTYNYHFVQTIFFVTIEYYKVLYYYPLLILLIDNDYRFVDHIFTYNYPKWNLMLS
jgi:hypothetical protein